MDSPEPQNLLFVYDALMRGGERRDFLSPAKADFIGPALAAGALYRIGDWPGLVPESSLSDASAAGGQVPGELFEIFDPETFFATLDVIAGYWPEQADRSLFVRRIITVRTAAGPTAAWAYLLNLPINGLPRFDPTSSNAL